MAEGMAEGMAEPGGEGMAMAGGRGGNLDKEVMTKGRKRSTYTCRCLPQWYIIRDMGFCRCYFTALC